MTQGWHEKQKIVLTKKGVELKAQRHRDVSKKNGYINTLRTPLTNDGVIKEKIEIAIDFIQHLYEHTSITTVYESIIIGSVVNGQAKKSSDIDIYLIGPYFDFEADVNPLFGENIGSEKFNQSPYLRKKYKEHTLFILALLVNALKKMQVQFKRDDENGDEHWHQLYKGELIHLLLTNLESGEVLKEEGKAAVKRESVLDMAARPSIVINRDFYNTKSLKSKIDELIKEIIHQRDTWKSPYKKSVNMKK